MSSVNHKTSRIIQDIVDYPAGSDEMTLGEFMAMLGDRAFFLAILLFSLPNSLPVPGIPGFSTITGLPILFIAGQIALGRSTIWMPPQLAGKRFSRQSMANILTKAMPAVIWLERFLKPRLLAFSSPLSERIWGALIVLLAGILIMPIPAGNLLPGLSISLIALSMLERDGLFLLATGIFIMATIGLMVEIIQLGFSWMHSILAWIF